MKTFKSMGRLFRSFRPINEIEHERVNIMKARRSGWQRVSTSVDDGDGDGGGDGGGDGDGDGDGDVN